MSQRRLELQEAVYEANMALHRSGLVLHTFGNVSGFDKNLGMFAIKPSGIPYPELSPEKMVLIDLEGRIVDGSLRPSTDTPTHLALYQHFDFIGGVAHTHSTYATAWAQAQKSIPCFGTTHADYFNGAIPCTSPLTEAQISGNYEYETGLQIINTVEKLDPRLIEMVLIANHGPFTWGKNAISAVYNSVTLEELAKIAFTTLSISPNAATAPKVLVDKHFSRKRGKSAYYGQK